MVSVPNGGPGTSWRFPPDQRDFELRVGVEGRGTVTARVVLKESGGRVVFDEQDQVDVDGSREITFPGLQLPNRGSYSLELDVRGPGVVQKSSVSIRRD
ncbi:MAG TPA: hypothetical protein VNE62_01110 [Actinomycetota bacterium]|nr:hypothetical protein [Actinomycetota bacterium]